MDMDVALSSGKPLLNATLKSWLATPHCPFAISHWSLAIGHSPLVNGHWSLVSGHSVGRLV